MLKDVIPPKARKPVYAIYAFVGFILGVFQVGFSAAELGLPTWITVAWAIFGFTGTAIGATALSNTNPTEYPDELPIRHGI